MTSLQEKNEKLKQLILRYKTHTDTVNKQLKEINSTHNSVFNNQLLNQTNSEELKGIIVMDNPGDEEYEQTEYLVGQAGKQFNNVIKSIGLQRKQVLVFNKSSITTHGTNDLCELYNEPKLREIFEKEQHETFDIIKDISQLLDIPIMIHGYASYLKNGKRFTHNEKGNRPLYIFFNNLVELEKDMKNKTHFYKHSSYGNLSKQIMAHCKLLDVEKLTFEQYLDLGKANCSGFFTE